MKKKKNISVLIYFHLKIAYFFSLIYLLCEVAIFLFSLEELYKKTIHIQYLNDWENLQIFNVNSVRIKIQNLYRIYCLKIKQICMAYTIIKILQMNSIAPQMHSSGKKEFKKTQNLKTLEILQWKASNLQVKGVISHTNWLNNQVFTYWYFFSSIQTRFHTFIHVSLKEQTDIIQGSKTH